MTTQEIQTLLNERHITDFEAKQLENANKLTSEAKELALILIDKHPDFPVVGYGGMYYLDTTGAKYKRLEAIFSKEQDLVKAFIQQYFAEEWREKILKGWQEVNSSISTATLVLGSYYDAISYFNNCMHHLLGYNLSYYEYLKYEYYTGNWQLAQVLEVMARQAMNENNDKTFDYLQENLQLLGEIGQVSNFVLRVLISCNVPKAWDLAEKTMLAAQRQDNIRSAVVSIMSIGSSGAFSQLLKAILTNDLLRFQSVKDVLANQVFQLNWYGQVNTFDLKPFLQTVVACLETPDLILKVIVKDNMIDCYAAFYAQKYLDKKQQKTVLEALLASENTDKQTMALAILAVPYFPVVTPNERHNYAIPFLKSTNPKVLSYALAALFNENYKTGDGLFDAIKNTLQYSTTAKEPTKDGLFYFDNIMLSKNGIVRQMLDYVRLTDKDFIKIMPYYDIMASGEHNTLVYNNFQQVLDYDFYEQQKKWNPTMPVVEKPTNFSPKDWERDLLFNALGDRDTVASMNAFIVIKYLTPTENEAQKLENLLTRKTASIRTTTVNYLLNLPEEMLQNSISRLLKSSNVEQRLAGLDMLQQLKLKKRLTDFVTASIDIFSQRKNISSKEEILLHDIKIEEKAVYNAQNGFGLFDPSKRLKLPILAAPTSGFFVEKMYKKPNLGLSMPLEKAIEQLKNLDKLITSQHGYEYDAVKSDKSTEKVVLGTGYFQPKFYISAGIDKGEKVIESLPLHELWLKWFLETKFTNLDLWLIANSICFDFENADYQSVTPKWLADLIADYTIQNIKYCNNTNGQWSINQGAIDWILLALNERFPFAKSYEVMVDITQHYYANIPEDKRFLKFPCKLESYETVPTMQTWRDVFMAYVWSFPMSDGNQKDRYNISDAFFERIFNVYCYFDAMENGNMSALGIFDAFRFWCRAYRQKLINIDELLHQLIFCEANYLNLLTDERDTSSKAFLEENPFIMTFINACRDRVLEIELQRGDSETPISFLAMQIRVVWGIDYLIRILKGLDKDILQRGYAYGGNTKKGIFSAFLKRCFPLQNEDNQVFINKIKDNKFTETRLVEAAIYAPQWLPFVENYLKWEGLQSMAWWLQAHTNSYMDVQKATEVAKYSSIEPQDFNDGAVDVAWFKTAYTAIGAAHFEVIYEAAKYVCDGTGHARAKLYADALLGKISLEDCKKRITEKRNKDYVVALGLIELQTSKQPSSFGGVGGGDILSRYKFLVGFKKESKEFGAQRQASEGLAVRLALDNLARTAGYADPIRLTWAMETIDAQEIMSKVKTLSFEETTISIEVNALGKAEFVATKAGKNLADVPAKFKKEAQVIELKDLKNALNAQHSRIRKGLEDAMLRGDEFELNELENLTQHPVIQPLLRSLVLMSDNKFGFYEAKNLVDAKGEKQALSAKSKIKIAHCTDLFVSGQWSDYQRFAFEKQVTQPFKQIFRELYTPSKDELQNGIFANRYKGCQIQKTQAAALLKTRGWTVDNYVGMQKVYHVEGFIARLHAAADWFNGGYAETPTIDNVDFIYRKKQDNVKLQDIPSRIFSEIMRDIDLIVSIANVGGLDIEASLSTIELRKVIVEETARLLKIENLEFKENHVFIQGKLDKYSLHLGSGVVHRIGGEMLVLEAVSTQARGRIFLPFVDEDPQTAKILSALLMLSGV